MAATGPIGYPYKIWARGGKLGGDYLGKLPKKERRGERGEWSCRKMRSEETINQETSAHENNRLILGKEGQGKIKKKEIQGEG